MNYDWVQPTLERIADLLRMPPVHNSYGTPKVSPKHVLDAVRVIWNCAKACTPTPVISPTKEGGLQFLWSGIDTEVKLVADVADPSKQLRVHIFGKAPGYQPGEFAGEEQVLERALRVVEQELGVSCQEASAP